MSTIIPLYRITTYDIELSDFTPQEGMSVPFENLTVDGLKAAMRDLRAMGYSCHRRGNEVTGHHDNDTSVMIERI